MGRLFVQRTPGRNLTAPLVSLYDFHERNTVSAESRYPHASVEALGDELWCQLYCRCSAPALSFKCLPKPAMLMFSFSFEVEECAYLSRGGWAPYMRSFVARIVLWSCSAWRCFLARARASPPSWICVESCCGTVVSCWNWRRVIWSFSLYAGSQFAMLFSWFIWFLLIVCVI